MLTALFHLRMHLFSPQAKAARGRAVERLARRFVSRNWARRIAKHWP